MMTCPMSDDDAPRRLSRTIASLLLLAVLHGCASV
jgi:hypothetical protein